MKGSTSGVAWVMILLYILLGVYFINVPFGFFEVPQFILDVNGWISLAAGILLILGGVNYKRFSNRRY